MMPMTGRPCASAVSATTFIRPTFPPPNTTSIPRATSAEASRSAAIVYSGRAPALDPA